MFLGLHFPSALTRVESRPSQYLAVIDPVPSATTPAVPPNSDKSALSHLAGQYAEPKHGFDFRRFWHSLVERIWIVALCVLAGLFLALGYLARTPNLYQGHTVLEVEFAEPTLITTEDPTARMRSMFLASQEALRTIEQNLTNQTLLARVIRSEGLAEDGGRALLGQGIVSAASSSATPNTGSSPGASKTQSAISVTSFTPL
jgi:uncharacterized protein involved in exopolysaccharide biosynthesis